MAEIGVKTGNTLDRSTAISPNTDNTTAGGEQKLTLETPLAPVEHKKQSPPKKQPSAFLVGLKRATVAAALMGTMFTAVDYMLPGPKVGELPDPITIGVVEPGRFRVDPSTITAIPAEHTAVTPSDSAVNAPNPSTGPPIFVPTAPPLRVQSNDVVPFDLQNVERKLVSALTTLGPSRIDGLDPHALVHAVDRAKLNLEVPITAGRYRIKGHDITIKPGTSIKVQLEVENGRIVPKARNRGSWLSISPTIDGPLWIEGRGLYVKDEGHGRGKLVADVGGWFDQAIGERQDLNLGRLLERALREGPAAASELPAGLFDLAKVKWAFADVTLANQVLDLGSMRLDLARDNHLVLSGSGQNAELSGHVGFDSLQLVQSDALLKTGAGSAELKVTATRSRSGQVQIAGTLSGVNVALQELSLRHGTNGLLAKDGRLEDGVIQIAMGPDGPVMSAAGRMSAQIQPSRLSLDGTPTTLSFSAGRFSGVFHAKPSGVVLDGDLEGAHVDLSKVISQSGRSRLHLERAVGEGSGHLFVDTKSATLRAYLNASKLEAEIADYQAHTPRMDVDLGSTLVSGKGELWIGPDNGLTLSGDLRIDGRFDDLVVNDTIGGGRVQLDLAAGSSVNGQLRTLKIGKQGLTLDASGSVNLGLERHSVFMPGVYATGDGKVAGTGHMKVDEQGLALDGLSLQLELRASDAKIAPKGTSFALDAGPGTELILKLDHAAFGGGKTEMRVGAGSRLDAVIEQGHIEALGHVIDLHPGTHARFTISELQVSDSGKKSLIGSLQMDIAESFSPARARALRDLGWLKLAGPASESLTVDRVVLSEDGSFQLQGVNSSFDGRFGAVTGVRSSSELTRPLLASHPELKTQQQLIDYFYRVGGKSWEGAAAAAKSYGLDLATLSQDRQAPIHRLRETPLPPPKVLPSRAEVGAADATELIGVKDVHASALDPSALLQNIRSGTVWASLPIQGRFGSGLSAVDFAPGTELRLKLTVKDGRIVTADSKGELTKPGDAIGWVEARGAYITSGGLLKLSLGGMVDPVLATLPLEVGKLFSGTEMAWSTERGSTPAAWSKLLDIDHARIEVRGAEFANHMLELPFGRIQLDPSTNVSFSATSHGVVGRFRLALNQLEIGGGAFAMKSNDGTADVTIRAERTEQGVTVDAMFDGMNVGLDGLAIRNQSGNFFRLGQGHGEGALRLRSESVKGADGELGPPQIRTDLLLSKFEGEVSGARFGNDATRVELGGAHFVGRILLEDGSLTLIQGQATGLDATAYGVALGDDPRAPRVESLRLVGDSWFEWTPDHLYGLNGKLDVDARIDADHLASLAAANALPNVSLEDGKAVVRLRVEHFDQLDYGKGDLFVLKGARGRIGVDASFNKISGKAGH